jgi:hypothetical protein
MTDRNPYKKDKRLSSLVKLFVGLLKASVSAKFMDRKRWFSANITIIFHLFA